MTTKPAPKKKRRPKQDTANWPGSLWTALAIDRRDQESKR